jgi:hypothetical protein
VPRPEGGPATATPTGDIDGIDIRRVGSAIGAEVSRRAVLRTRGDARTSIVVAPRAPSGVANRAPNPWNTDGVDIGRANTSRALVIGCGALARELLAVTARIPGLEIACLPPDLHNRPDGIPGAVRERIAKARRDGYERIFVAYADCGTGGLLEPVLAEAGVERLPGAHCYEVFAGSAEFAALADAEPGTFWLTDFLARNFERLVIRGLGIDRHPELQATYFANYTRVVFLSQTEDPDLLVVARRAAERLGLTFEHRPTTVANLAAPILAFAVAPLGTDSRGAGVRDELTTLDSRSRPISAGSVRPTRFSRSEPANPVAHARGARIPAGGHARRAPAARTDAGAPS